MRIGILVLVIVLGSLRGDAEEVRAASAGERKVEVEATVSARDEVVIGEGKYRFSVDTTQAPDLAPWVKDKLTPVLKEWYPKIVGMLPGKDFEAPRTFSVVFDPKYTGVAATTGTLVVCNPEWYRKELDREGLGSVVHELVHVVQQYGRRRVPGWLTEGVADYIRWYLFEPESKGCEIPPAAADRVRHDQSYRVSANFLSWVVNQHDKELIRELNVALREGRYAPAFWEERTKKDLEALAAEWKTYLRDGQADSKDSKDSKD